MQLDYISPWIQTTNECNLKCPYCHIKQNSEYMSDEVYELIFDKLYTSYKNGVTKKVYPRISGGEPLLVFDRWKDKALDFKKKVGGDCLIEVLTNLTILPNDILKYVANNEFLLNVSLDGIDYSKPYKNGLSSSKVVLDNIERLKKYQPHFYIMTTLQDNLVELPKLAEYVGENKFDWNITLEHSYNGYPDYRDIVNTLKLVIKVLKDKRYDLEAVRFNYCGIGKQMSCRAGKELFAIYINGDIFTCHTLFGSKPLANIKDGRDLIEIFTDKENSFNDLKLDDSCKVCSIGDICNGDCPLYNTQKRKKYFCKIAKEFMLSLIENKIEVCKEMLYA
jgi:uncharacterized protein